MDTFLELPDRAGTGSLKWDRYGKREVLPMWVADMDFRSPEPVIEALRERVEHGVFGYTIPYELPNRAVADYLSREHGVEFDADALYWMPGLVPALNLICRAFGGPGTETMTAVPIYPPFLSAPVNAGGEALRVEMVRDATVGWRMDFDLMEDKVSEKTRIFFLCNPHNPTGKVFQREELLQLADFCERHDLVLVSDEIHCDLILEAERRHCSALGLGETVAKRLIALYAPSKTYNLPGLSCAYAIIPNPELRHRLKREARGIITEINALGYVGCAAAYNEGAEWRRRLLTVLRGNRDALIDALAGVWPRLKIYPIEATYLAWIDARELGLADPAAHFEAHGLGLSNGADFGAPGWVRFNFGAPQERVHEGIRRLLKAV
ncbi:MAG: MalY/PatB family protein [Puniceicoccaceae bacterium]